MNAGKKFAIPGSALVIVFVIVVTFLQM